MLGRTALQLQPVDEPCEPIWQNDRSSEQFYAGWVQAAGDYSNFLRQRALKSGASAADPVDFRLLTIRIDQTDDTSVLDRSLQASHRALRPDDILVVHITHQISGKSSAGIQRDLISRALFNAGFDCPMIWAGRKLLEAENESSLANRFLPSGALGAGPRSLSKHTKSLDVGPEELIAIARRSALAPPGERRLRLSVVMPVFNEKDTFREVMDALLAKVIPGFDIEICLVESNSTDGTRTDVLRYADHPRVRLLLEDRPSGKGHAVRKGLELASGDIVIIQDADLEYELADYEKLLDPIRRLETSFVLGSRHPAGKNGWQIRHFTEQRGLSEALNVGHLFFTGFLNVIFRQETRDPFTMYKVFRRDCINNVHFECNRFDFDLELFGKLIRNGYRPVEIAVGYCSRSFQEGKKVSMFADPPRWIRAGLLHRFSNLYVWPKYR